MGLYKSHSEEDVTWQEGTERYNIAALKVEEEGYEPRNTGGLWQLEKARKPILPYASSKECSLVTPGLQSSETFNLQTVRFILVKPLNLWSCITAVIVN